MGTKGTALDSAPDDTVIDIADERALRHWADTLGVSQETLREAVADVGPALGAVRGYLARPGSNNDPDPNIARQIVRPGPDRTSPFSDAPDMEGMGQGGQPPHQSPGQRPPDPVVQDQIERRKKA